MAFRELGEKPRIKKENWADIINPFSPGLFEKGLVEDVKEYMLRKHRLGIKFPNEQLDIFDWIDGGRAKVLEDFKDFEKTADSDVTEGFPFTTTGNIPDITKRRRKRKKPPDLHQWD